MGTEQLYDAIFEKISHNKQGLNPQYYYILLAVILKVIGLFVGIAMMMVFVLDVPQAITEQIRSIPTRPPRVIAIENTATSVPEPTQTYTIEVVEATEHILPVDVTPQAEFIIVHTATPVPTIERFDPSNASQNIEIGIPLSGFTALELPLVISQDYNMINENRDNGHHGVDFGFYDYQGNYILGLPINAVFAGTVAGIIDDRPPLGHAVMVETPYESLPVEYCNALSIVPGQSLYILYAHMIEAPRYQVGDAIAWQQQVGNVGKSQTAEAHLHLETRIGESGYTFDSMAYYDTATTKEERDTYMDWRTSGSYHPFDPMILFTEMYPQ
ncbi:MAG: peptidoglycan DD-metalloendopeptidase family protein [Anaerolineaceae bacterium]|nr:peptidoglycan DD-metalloendopeptidase family protein [Anaerolineaceae bacterium]